MEVQFEVTETVRLRRTYEAKITQAEVLEHAGISRREFLEDPETHIEAFIEENVGDDLVGRMKLVDTRPDEESELIEFDGDLEIEGLPCE